MMKLKLKDNKVQKLIFTDLDSTDLDNMEEDEFGLRFEPNFSLGNNKFSIQFEFQCIVESTKILIVHYDSCFEVDEELSERFITSKFPTVNAPAIAFPFLRAFISNYLLSSGYNPILLPSINFTQFKSNSKHQVS